MKNYFIKPSIIALLLMNIACSKEELNVENLNETAIEMDVETDIEATDTETTDEVTKIATSASRSSCSRFDDVGVFLFEDIDVTRDYYIIRFSVWNRSVTKTLDVSTLVFEVPIYHKHGPFPAVLSFYDLLSGVVLDRAGVYSIDLKVKRNSSFTNYAGYINVKIVDAKKNVLCRKKINPQP